MSLDNVTPGKKVPESFNVIIEIPMNADPIKYEVDKESGAIFVDRFMTTAMHYPTNYGYVPRTLSGDGDPVDVLVITPFPLIPGVVVRCRPIGVLKMEDDGGHDEKIIAVPSPKLTKRYVNVHEVTDLPQIQHGRMMPLTGPGLGTRLKPSFLESASLTRRRSSVQANLTGAAA